MDTIDDVANSRKMSGWIVTLPNGAETELEVRLPHSAAKMTTYIPLAGALGIPRDRRVEDLKARIKDYLGDPCRCCPEPPIYSATPARRKNPTHGTRIHP